MKYLNLIIVIVAVICLQLNFSTKVLAQDKFNQLSLRLNDPINLSFVNLGDFIEVEVTLKTHSTASSAELLINYDPEVLEFAELNVDDQSLGINQIVDSSSGKVAIDVAKRGVYGSYTMGSKLVSIKFKVLALQDTWLEFDHSTKLGYPNTLSNTSDFNHLKLLLYSKCEAPLVWNGKLCLSSQPVRPDQKEIVNVKIEDLQKIFFKSIVDIKASFIKNIKIRLL